MTIKAVFQGVNPWAAKAALVDSLTLKGWHVVSIVHFNQRTISVQCTKRSTK